MARTVDRWADREGSAFAVAEVEALERAVGLLREWRSAPGLGPSAIVGQLSELTDRLRGAADNPLTRRVFLAGAELAKIVASMYYDEGVHPPAQRYYVLAVRMAKAAGQESFGAATLAALARQSFDLGQPADGLEIIGLAQHGTRHTASPRPRTMLASREAWGHAQLGHVYAFHRAVDAAETSFIDAGPLHSEPRWLSGLDAAELSGVIGARFRDLARHDPAQARHAVDYIGRALELRDPVRVRNRSFDLIGLARAHLITGDPDRAASLIGEALPTVSSENPGRLGRSQAGRLEPGGRQVRVGAGCPGRSRPGHRAGRRRAEAVRGYGACVSGSPGIPTSAPTRCRWWPKGCATHWPRSAGRWSG